MEIYNGATVQGFTEYHENRGREIPATWDEDKINASLLVASEWLDGVYGSSFNGQKTAGFLQVREWPRIGATSNTDPIYVFPKDVIPSQIISAVYEAAYKQAKSAGSLVVDYTPNKYKSVTIEGALSVDYSQFTSSADVQTQFTEIDRIMTPILGAINANFSGLSGSVFRV